MSIPWSANEDETLEKLWREIGREEIENSLPGRTWDAISRRACRLKFRRLQHESFSLKAPPDLRIYTDQPRISSSDGVAVWSDLHIPFFHEDFCNSALDFAKKNKIKKLILNGDVLDQTCFLRVQKPDPRHMFETEIEEGQRFFEILLSQFKEITWVMSNHDKRLIYFLGKQINSSQFLRLVTNDPKVKITDYHWAEIDDWLVVYHPKNARKVPLSLARDMARKYRKSMIQAHDHMFALGLDDSGEDIIACGGYMADRSKLDYVNLELNTYPAWQHGFFWVKDGKVDFKTDHWRLMR